MKSYVIRRFLYMLLLLLFGSMVSFMVITLPPGDYLSYYVDRVSMSGASVSEEDLAGLRAFYGLDDPVYVQYGKWLFRVLQGDLGRSFGWNRPVAGLIWERLPKPKARFPRARFRSTSERGRRTPSASSSSRPIVCVTE